MPGGPGQAMQFGKSKARFMMEAETGVMFDDVAGVTEAKRTGGAFLKQPERFTSVGAQFPRPAAGCSRNRQDSPGQSDCWRSRCSLFSLQLKFVEIFVVWSQRYSWPVQESQGKQPLLIFIDEIDAVGRQRGAGIGGGNDERTDPEPAAHRDDVLRNSGIIIIAATNRPDVLDSALMRPGRFDRQVTVDAPDIKGRLSILEVHCRNKKLEDDLSRALRVAPPGSPTPIWPT